jgi:hypothetical protein
MSGERLKWILGAKLKHLRLERGLTLKELAEVSGLSISYLSEIEKGKKYPKPDKLLDLAAALELPFDELVSLRVADDLEPLRQVARSPFLQEFPLELFGLHAEDLFSLMTDDPERAGALIHALLDIGRLYDIHVEQFLMAALRAYQQMNHNCFPDLEKAAEAYRHERGWGDRPRLALEDLTGILEAEHGVRVDETVLHADPELAGFRSVLAPGRRPVLHLNSRLRSIQKSFVVARELGALRLGLGPRAASSPWLEVETFDEILNNFKASYFAGALLLPQEPVLADLDRFLARETWDGAALLDLMGRYGVTPEMFLHRWTQLAPRSQGLEEIFFARFHHYRAEDLFRLTKVFNLSRVPVPHALGRAEHHCRRWAALRLLRELAEDPAAGTPLVAVQRSHFLNEDAEFFVISLARPLALAPEDSSSVALGFLLDDRFRERVAFAVDPAVARIDVNLTCERCPLPRSECHERAAPPRIQGLQEERERRKLAVGRLLSA